MPVLKRFGSPINRRPQPTSQQVRPVANEAMRCIQRMKLTGAALRFSEFNGFSAAPVLTFTGVGLWIWCSEKSSIAEPRPAQAPAALSCWYAVLRSLHGNRATACMDSLGEGGLRE
jgi:hypothetical protein